MAEAVKVVVRCRPTNEREQQLGCDVVVKMDTGIAQVQLWKPGAEGKQGASPKMFTFDSVYYMEDTTETLYGDICFPLVANVLDGYNGTIFAYGQTGCGKSYTMVGVEDPASQVGVIPRAFDHIFDAISVTEGVKFLVQASYLEIYNEEVRDLLGKEKDVKKKLDLKEHPERGVYVSGLSHHRVHNRKDLEKVMAIGSKNRSMGATLMNVDSSRSHCIFTIDIEMMVTEDDDEKVRSGRLNLVDLAGSERQSKTGATGQRLKEATKINLSLSALGNVISALVDGKSKHIPYRDSKLTRLLQSSLGGNTKTLMVSCISPADNNYDETLSTLRYANRAKNIQNKPRVNEDPKDALLRQYQEEIKQLKMMLLGQVDPAVLNNMGVVAPPQGQPQGRDYEAEMEAIRASYEQQLAQLKEEYGTEHSNRTKLEEEMALLRTNFEEQLALAQKQHEGRADEVALGDITLGGVEGDKGVPGDGQAILVEHEKAIQKLTSLQEGLIGGENAGNEGLKKELESRKLHADEKLLQLKHANSFLDDDDGILEKIFNNLTDEVRAKTRALEKCQMKLKSTEEDIMDQASEFQIERQDFLDTIRSQERQIQLQQQLLDTVVPLLRRDCNYYNIDKMKSESKFDEELGEWAVPKVAYTNTSLATVNSKTSITGVGSPSHQRLTTKRSSGHLGESASVQNPSRRHSDDDPFGTKLMNKTDNLDYFAPKRAQDILAKCSSVKGAPPSENKLIKGGLGSSGIMKSPSHSNGPSNMDTVGHVGKGIRLDSLGHPLPGIDPCAAEHDQSAVKMADELIAQKKKTKHLEPLNEFGRKPFF